MRIKTLAQSSGLSTDTIRFYEKKGLLEPDLVHRSANNYRDYAEACLKRLELIQKVKNLGFTLTEIQVWIWELENNQLSVREKNKIIRRKIQDIETRIATLDQIKQQLASCLVPEDSPDKEARA
jgi:MerR family transcriptional regulator, copper efflux regulator